jgi:hypothetical protein
MADPAPATLRYGIVTTTGGVAGPSPQGVAARTLNE